MAENYEAMALSNLALRMVLMGNVAAGFTLHKRAIAMDPDDWRWKFAFAGSLVNHGYIDDAEQMLGSCPAMEPTVMAALAFIMWERGNAAQAASILRLACRQRKGDVDMLTAHAQATLASGNWEHGFQYHECRERRQQLGAPIPRWNGERVGRLLVWSDEGVGDAVNFARFIPQIAERVDRVVFGIPGTLICLLAGYERYAEILPMDATQGIQADAEVALMSTPLLCGTTPDTIPPDPGLIGCAAINGTLTAHGKRNIGIAWSGNPTFKRAHLRDMPLETMLGIAEDPDNQLYSLVVGPRSADIAKAGAQKLVMDLSGFTISDFSATAAAVREMDAVVTTCNGVAHIAAALGVPTFLMLATLPDWRWLEGRNDTPWYPSVRLFRQAKPREWEPVVAAVREALRAVPVKGAVHIPAPAQGGWGERTGGGAWH